MNQSQTIANRFISDLEKDLLGRGGMGACIAQPMPTMEEALQLKH